MQDSTGRAGFHWVNKFIVTPFFKFSNKKNRLVADSQCQYSINNKYSIHGKYTLSNYKICGETTQHKATKLL